MTTHEASIALTAFGYKEKLLVTAIIRCQSCSNYTTIYTATKKYVIAKTLSWCYSLLRPYGFIRPHRSHLVNPLYINFPFKFDQQALMLHNGESISISRRKLAITKEQMNAATFAFNSPQYV